MARREVTCVKNDSQKRTIQIGGPGWRCSVSEAMLILGADPESFYRVDGATGARAYVKVIAQSYLRTQADPTKRDNLDSLPACP